MHRCFRFFRDDDDYFTCITKAAEILSNPVKRRAFDSVDPTFDDSVPPEIKSGDKVSPCLNTCMYVHIWFKNEPFYYYINVGAFLGKIN